MTRPTDPQFDQRIADWLDEDPRRAPGSLLDTVLAAIPSTPQRRASRVPWGSSPFDGSSRMISSGSWSIAAAIPSRCFIPNE